MPQNLFPEVSLHRHWPPGVNVRNSAKNVELNIRPKVRREESAQQLIDNAK
jgi:hypothetical protein